MTRWFYALGVATVVSGNYGDELEVKWLHDCWTKVFDERADSSIACSEGHALCWRRLDVAMSRALQGMIQTSDEFFLLGR